MKNKFIKIFLPLCVLCFIIVSCIDEKYDLENIDNTIQVGGEHLVLPIGETEQIKLVEFLNKDNLDFIEKLENGEYALKLSDKLDFGKSMPNFSFDIKDINFPKQVIGFSIGEFDGGLTLAAISKSVEINPSLPKLDLGDIAIPAISKELNVAMDLGKYNSDIQLGLNNVNLDAPKVFNFSEEEIKALELLPLTEIPIPSDKGEATVAPKEANVNIAVTLVDNVTNVDNIVLGSNAKMKITLEVTNSNVLSSGAIIPDIKLNPSDVFAFAEGVLTSGNIVFGSENLLNNTNSFSSSKTVSVSALNITPEMWNENILNLTKKISVAGKLQMSDVTISKANLNKLNDLGLAVKIEFVDFDIESVDFDLKENVSKNIDGNVSFEMPQTEVPSQVTSLGNMTFKDPSTISVKIDVKNAESLPLLSKNIEKIKLVFPKEFILENTYKDNIVELKNYDYSKPLVVKVLGFDASETLKDSKISYKDNIQYNVAFSVGGTITSSAISVDKPVSVDVKINSNIAYNDISLQVADISQDLPEIDEAIEVELPDGIEENSIITVTTEEGTNLTMLLDVPALPLNVQTAEKGIKISLPLSFNIDKDKFDLTKPASSSFVVEENALLIKGDIPSKIEMPIYSLKVKAQKKEGSEKLYLLDAVKIAGGIALEGDQINASSLDGVNEKKINVSIDLPSIVAKDVTMSGISKSFDQVVDISFDQDNLEYVKSVKEMFFDNTKVVLNVSLKDIPDLQAPIMIKGKIEFPEILAFADERVKDNVFVLDQEIKDNKLNISLNLDRIVANKDIINNSISISEQVKVTGEVYINDPVINPDELVGKEPIIEIDGGVVDVDLVKVSGVIDYDLEKVSEEIVLSDIPDFMKGDNVNLDITNPHIELIFTSNMGVSLNGNATLTPYIDGAVNPDPESVQQFDINVGVATPEAPLTTKFWVAKDEVGMLDGFIFRESALPNLIKRIPDAIKIEVTGGTNTEDLHIIDLKADPVVSLDYNIVVPFNFGEDLLIELRDTIADLPDVLAKIIKGNEIAITGEVESSLPIQLELVIELLDKNMKPTGIQSTKQVIKQCPKDKESIVSPLNLTIADKNGTLTEVSALALKFVATSPVSSGKPITDDSFVRASLKLLVEGGIVLDLDDLSDKKSDNK